MKTSNILLKFHCKTDVNVTMITLSFSWWTAGFEPVYWNLLSEETFSLISQEVQSNFPTLDLLLIKMRFLKQLSTITIANPEVKYNPIHKIYSMITGTWSDCDYLNRERVTML